MSEKRGVIHMKKEVYNASENRSVLQFFLNLTVVFKIVFKFFN